jgi:cytochrome c oxidase subunit 4
MATAHITHEDHHVNYMAIYWWILILTILEVVASVPQAGPSYPQLPKGFFLVIMALAKAGLVAAYFMHLRFENLTLAFIALVPLILCTSVVLAVMPNF